MLKTQDTKKDRLVRCPNMCNGGLVKFYPDPERALYTTESCRYCGGVGKVHASKYERIDSQI